MCPIIIIIQPCPTGPCTLDRMQMEVHRRGVHCGPHNRGPVPPASRAEGVQGRGHGFTSVGPTVDISQGGLWLTILLGVDKCNNARRERICSRAYYRKNRLYCVCMCFSIHLHFRLQLTSEVRLQIMHRYSGHLSYGPHLNPNMHTWWRIVMKIPAGRRRSVQYVSWGRKRSTELPKHGFETILCFRCDRIATALRGRNHLEFWQNFHADWDGTVHTLDGTPVSLFGKRL